MSEANIGKAQKGQSKIPGLTAASPAPLPSRFAFEAPDSHLTNRKRRLEIFAPEPASKRFAGTNAWTSPVSHFAPRSTEALPDSPPLSASLASPATPAEDSDRSLPVVEDEQEPAFDLPQDASEANCQQVASTRGLKGRIEKRYLRWPSIVQSTRIRGLMNPGFNCYRNAVLQCLLQQPLMFRYLDLLPCSCDRDHHDDQTLSQCSVCALRTLFHAYWLSDDRFIPESGPVMELQRFNRALLVGRDIPASHDMLEDFNTGAQSDAYDFLRFVLERCQAQSVAEKERLSQDDLFKVEHETEWLCDQCGQITKAVGGAELSQGVGLSVNINHPPGWDLRYYLQAAHTTTVENIRCYSEHCRATGGYDMDGKNASGEYMTAGKTRVKRAYVTRSPEILVIRLMLFDWQAEGQVKIMDRVALEEYLDLGEFCREARATELYRLDGVVAHGGSGVANSGHYVCAIRERDGRTFCVCSDDEPVTRSRGGTIEELMCPTYGYGSPAQPYLLFYSRVHDHDY
ncbi:cysteine proteinase [Teratosphaeria destructans]|uniref:ubiquitinyl hydrolase 1 n=1 Tax=Teratosphaeria destructans TaxID=418781 RepID=A0A9W7SZK5_9PEZI|nr:cysteine proteinase [Teratosphaeria destructans]